jgi:hypothetical protein
VLAANPGEPATGAKYASAPSCSAYNVTRAATAGAPSAVEGAMARHFRSGKAHDELHEARAVKSECRAQLKGNPPDHVIRRVTGGADDQDLRRDRNALDEGVDGVEPLSGRGRLKRLEHLRQLLDEMESCAATRTGSTR